MILFQGGKNKMKMKLILIVMLLCITSGCFKRDMLEDIEIYTTNYPIEYITKRLYGKHSQIQSIYPDGVSIDHYKLTNKQMKDYSKASIFIFNWLLEKEKNYVVNMMNYNENIKIIDTTMSMEYTNDINELWLNPSNFLMLAQNIRNGLDEYISNHYLKEEINNNYDALKLEISNLDAKFKLVSESSTRKTIVVSSDLFKFLEKYNFTVISLEENDNLTQKTISDVEKMIYAGQIRYIFTKDRESVNHTIEKLMKKTGIETLNLNTLSTLNETDRKDNKDYITIMNENIEQLKQELYN